MPQAAGIIHDICVVRKRRFRRQKDVGSHVDPTIHYRPRAGLSAHWVRATSSFLLQGSGGVGGQQAGTFGPGTTGLKSLERGTCLATTKPFA